MKNEYMPYMINLEYEWKTYKNVGKDYGKCRNGEQTKYLLCNTYSEWKMHVNSVINRNIMNYDDMIHWLIGKKNSAKRHLNVVKAILIPSYISLISVYKAFAIDENDSMIVLGILLVMISFTSTWIMSEAAQKVEFYEDFIEMAQGIS